jgi:hypothetical protein
LLIKSVPTLKLIKFGCREFFCSSQASRFKSQSADFEKWRKKSFQKMIPPTIVKRRYHVFLLLEIAVSLNEIRNWSLKKEAIAEKKFCSNWNKKQVLRYFKKIWKKCSRKKWKIPNLNENVNGKCAFTYLHT